MHRTSRRVRSSFSRMPERAQSSLYYGIRGHFRSSEMQVSECRAFRFLSILPPWPPIRSIAIRILLLAELIYACGTTCTKASLTKMHANGFRGMLE
jgi:hypothetical protein